IGTADNNTTSITLGDIDADGDLDVIAGNNGQTNNLYLNDGSAVFTAGAVIGAADNTNSITLGDIDADGDLDVIAGNGSSNGQANMLYLNNGNGAFTAGTAIGTDTDNTYSITLGDIDADGDLDVIAGNYSDVTTNKLYLNDGSGGFSDATGAAVGTADTTRSITLGDIDGDGHLDVIAGNYSQTNTLYLNDSSDGFSGAEISADIARTYSITLG
ncbi:MAG: VCBS repeat-containing protein, partial [Deltaproteobacteria bacterium]|nr:VCBS repeat-containing protein [Deltaproteobacteria bacterium]